MSEHIAAKIHVGGRIPTSLVPALCQAIANEGVALGFRGNGYFTPVTAEDLLKACTECDNVPLLCLYDDQASWGEFEQLEAFLRDHTITYDRFSEAKYDYSAKVAHFRRNKGLFVVPTDSAYRPIVVAADLAGVEKALAQAIEQVQRKDTAAAHKDNPESTAFATSASAAGTTSAGDL